MPAYLWLRAALRRAYTPVGPNLGREVRAAGSGHSDLTKGAEGWSPAPEVALPAICSGCLCGVNASRRVGNVDPPLPVVVDDLVQMLVVGYVLVEVPPEESEVPHLQIVPVGAQVLVPPAHLNHQNSRAGRPYHPTQKIVKAIRQFR